MPRWHLEWHRLPKHGPACLPAPGRDPPSPTDPEPPSDAQLLPSMATGTATTPTAFHKPSQQQKNPKLILGTPAVTGLFQSSQLLWL